MREDKKMSESILEMRNVTKTFPGVKALSNVNLDLKKGEILGICGENGAGKSTLMKVLSGSFSANQYEGDILINGKEVRFDSVATAQSYGIEMVYQEINMLMMCTVAENIFINNIPGEGKFVDFKKLFKDTQELLDYAGLTDIYPKEIAHNLNSGQMAMVSLLRAYAKNPKVLVLDEPTGALTNNEVDILMRILNELRDKGVSCIYISHKLEEIYRICDRVMVMRDGEVVGTHLINEVREDELIEEMIGRKVVNLYPKESVEIGEDVFRVEDIVVPHPTIKNRNIVDHVSFKLYKGEILGIGGLVGAGRSEILGAIFGQIKKGVSKKVFVKGREVTINSPADAMEVGIGFVTEERKQNGIIWMLSIKDNIVLASLNDLPGKVFVDNKVEESRAQELYDQLHIKAPSINTKVVSLSGGNQQKVVISKWLLKKPDILLIDEPTRGIDVGAKAEIYKLMNELTQSGISIIMVSSDMPELVNMSDRCLVISNGRITGELSKEEISDTAVMKAAIM